MVELSYNSKLKSPGRLSAPLAAKFVAELLFGAAWSDNPRVKKKPVYRSRDGAYRRCHLFLRNGKYTMKTKVVSIPEGRQQEFAEAYRLFKEGKDLIGHAVLDGKLKGEIELVRGPALVLDRTRSGLLRAQLNTIFTTGYARVPRGSFETHGLVVFATKDLEKLAKTGAKPGSVPASIDCLKA